MPPSQYLLHVNSRPTEVSDATWSQWYQDEHLPDLYNAKVCDRATFYEEIPSPLDQDPKHPGKFLALYQTGHAECLNLEAYQNIRTTSELFEQAGGSSDMIQTNGDFDARYYTLAQEFDPKNTGETVSPHIITVYMNPQDPEDFERWYREEHLPLLSKLPGYRQSLRYKLSATQTPQTKGSGPEEVQPYLAIHEVDDVEAALGSREAEEANTTPWTVKHVRESRPFIARAWRRISAEGYE